MIRSVLTAIVLSLGVSVQEVPLGVARAGGPVDADLWSPVGVTRITDRAPAPAVVLNDLAGRQVDLRDFRGRLVMLYFWATW